MSIIRRSAGDLERELSGWPDSRFVSLCNALIWAYAGRSRASLSAGFTEREKARDQGIDADVWVEASGEQPDLGPVLNRGWNVFQFKRRDLVSERKQVLSSLKQKLQGAAAHVSREAGRCPGSYTLFTNVHLSRTQSDALRKAIAQGSSEELRVAVNGAAEIVTMLNDQPHIRAAFFGAPRFETWQDAWNRLSAVKLSGAHVELVGRDQELAQLRQLVDEPSVRAILVYGPHDIGKDRLILEATKPGKEEILVASDPQAPDAREIQEIGSASQEALLIVEDADGERLPDLLPRVLAQDKVKLVCSIPTVAHASLPNYGFDERVQPFPVAPLSESASRELLKKAHAGFDYPLESWVLEKGGGIPGVLLLAASLGPSLRKTPEDFLGQVGRAFQQRVRRELGEAALEELQVFSLLTRVAEPELETLARTLGHDPSKVHGAIHDLQASGLLLKRGQFYEVTPPIFAQFLASQAVAGERLKLYRLVAALESPARIRLFRRLGELPSSPELREFWQEALGPDGLYADANSIAAAGHLLPVLAEAAPEATLACLQRILVPLSVEERKAISRESRRHLVRALDSLLMQQQAAGVAIWLLLLLAEAKNETWANNATGLFYESFLPRHPQVAASLSERADVLRKGFNEGTKAQQHLAVEAAREALRDPVVVTLRRSSAFLPPQRPAVTYGELHDYGVKLLELLVQKGSNPTADPSVATAARKAVPEVAEQVAHMLPEAALGAFRQCLVWLRGENHRLEPAQVLNSLERTLANWEKKEATHSRHVEEGRRILKEIEHLEGFFQQVQRWAGERRIEQWEETQRQLRQLAQQVVNNPASLAEDLFDWLCDSNRGWLFFLFLGEQDAQRRVLPQIEAKAKHVRGARALGSYCAAWAKVDRPGLAAYLDAIEQRQICSDAMLYAAQALAGEPGAVRVVLALLGQRRIEPIQVANALRDSRWLQSLEPRVFLKILLGIGGSSLESAPAAIDLLSAWLDAGRVIEGELREFAWRCLETPASRPEKSPWYRDRLAANLASVEPDRGFASFEKLLQQESQGGWDPLAGGGCLNFWEVLLKTDRQRALHTVFSASSYAFLGCFRTTVFDQRRDAPLLIEIASHNARTAMRIAQALNFDQPGFWEITLAIAARYPDDEYVEAGLNLTALGLVVQGGTLAEGYERRRREVERVLQDPATPPAAKPWLRKLEAALKREVAGEVIWEYDVDARDLQRFVKDRNAPERLWAIGRILKHARWEDVQRLLTPADIEEALPLVDLPESQKRALETALQYWLRRV